MCNTFTVALFYMFASIFTNDEFMNPRRANSMISSNIYLPSVLLAIFMMLFIPYSYHLFQKERKSEYGILMTLGMNQTQGMQKLLFETIIISIAALFSGLVIGTGISIAFYGVLVYLLDIAGLSIIFCIKPYEVTAVFYLFIWLYTLIIYIVESQNMQIIDWMKARFRRRTKSFGSLLCIGLFLFGTSIFFSEISINLYPLITKSALEYSPYDLLYSNIFGMNDRSIDEVKELLSNYGVTVTKEKELPYLRGAAFNLLSVSKVNKTFHLDYQVNEGEFLMLYQYDLNDGNDHVMIDPKNIGIDTKKVEIRLQCIGNDVRILFNDNPTFADQTLILSDKDFDTIKEQGLSYSYGNINMFNFSDWRESKKGLDALQSSLMKENGVDKADEHYYEITSKFYVYQIAKQSSEFLLFVFTFILILFFAAGNLVIYFKIQTELEEEKCTYRTLYRIGITDTEMIRMLHRKNVLYFLFPVTVGIVVGTLLNGIIYAYYCETTIGFYQGLWMVAIVILFEIFLANWYSDYEWNTICPSNEA